jgi:LacI family transcriptional regulator
MELDPHHQGARPPTLEDVARLAGVSVATASKALNGREEVSPVTRARVHDAAEKLLFAPNSRARGLAAGQTGVIGMITSDTDGRYSFPVLMGAEDAAGQGMISVFFSETRGDTPREQSHLHALLGHRVDGLIVVGDTADSRPSVTSRSLVPIVYAYAPSVSPEDTSIVSDNFSAGRLAIEHLLSLGRTRIVLLAGERGRAAAQDRVKGAVAALAEAGLHPVGGNAAFGAWSEAWGRDAAADLITRKTAFDAIFCCSDQIARGALDVLRARRLSVPKEVAVVGCGNWSAMTLNSRPRLTSIDLQLREVGRVAAQRLFAAMRGQRQPGVEYVPCTLVPRESTVG